MAQALVSQKREGLNYNQMLYHSKRHLNSNRDKFLSVYYHFSVAVSVATIIAKKDAYPQGQCNMDQFRVTSGGNHNPPMICGVNSGEHSNYCYSNYRNILLFDY